MNEIARKLDETRQKALTAYSENVALRAAICAIPYIGGSLDVLLSAKGHSIVQGRISELFDQLREELIRVGESKVNKSYLESEEWFDLVIKAIEAAARTRHRQKIKAYAQIVRGSLVSSSREEGEPEEYLAVIEELSLKEFQLALALYEQQKDWEYYHPTQHSKGKSPGREAISRSGAYNQLHNFDFGVPFEERPYLFLRLVRSGLCQEARESPGIFMITQRLKRIVQHLNDCKTES